MKGKKGVFLVLLLVLITCVSCTFFRMLKHGESTVYDFKYFPQRIVHAGDQPYRFEFEADNGRIPQQLSFSRFKDINLDKFLARNKSLAFLILQNDKLISEMYFNGHRRESYSMAFSMTKSFTSILIGCAIDDGLIESVRQPVTDFVPELAQSGFDVVTLEHLLQMTSGMDYIEHDNPFGLHPRFYWTQDQPKELLALKRKDPPGKSFSYKSGEAQLLGYILSRVLGEETISSYLERKLWKPMGMEYDGYFGLDCEDGLEKTFCCLSGRARDFLKIGRLYLNDGNWNGNRLVPGSWVQRSTEIDTSNGSTWKYQYQWWIADRDSGAFMAVGHLGQYIYVDRQKKIVILRLGTGRGEADHNDWVKLFSELANTLYQSGN